MTLENSVFVVNQQALIQAALEMEKQETLLSLMLLHCVDQLEDVRRKLELVMTDSQVTRARGAFLNLFMSSETWGRIISDEQLAQWETEFQAEKRVESGAKKPHSI